MVTIKDISKQAGVSIAAVSKVLNGDYSSVSSDTKERIIRTAKELNYRPNRLARGLVMNRTNIIGLIVSDITNPFFAALARGIEDKADAYDYKIILCNTDESSIKEASYVDVLIQYNVDGVIVTSSEHSNNEHLLQLKNYNIPVVAIDRQLDEDTYTVFMDNFHGIYMAAENVINSGHRKIAFIGGDQFNTMPDRRLDGYLKALEDNGIKIDKDLILSGSYQAENGYVSTMALLDKKKDFSAIVCGNDLIAFGAIKALRERGLRIPQDVSVTGYDDIYLSSLIEPNLTTVQQPVYEMGSYAADILIKLLDKEEVEEKNSLFDPKLIVRDSVAPLNKLRKKAMNE